MSKPARKPVKKPARKAAPAARKPVAKREALKAVKAKPIKHLAKSSHARPQPRPPTRTMPDAVTAAKASPLKVVARPVTPAAAASNCQTPAAKPPAGGRQAGGRQAGGCKPADAKAAAPQPTRKSGKAGARAGAEKLEVRLPPTTPEDRQSQLKLLIARGKEQGFLTYAEVNDHLPSEIVDPEQIEDIVQMINDMGIPVYEKAPDAESLLMREPVVGRRRSRRGSRRRARDHASTPSSAARPTRCACTCARWAPSSCSRAKARSRSRSASRKASTRSRRAVALPADARPAAAHVRARQGRPGPPRRHHRRVHRPECAGRHRGAASIRQARREGRARTTKPRTAEGDSSEEEEAIETGPDPEEAARRFASLHKLHALVIKTLDEKGAKDPKTIKTASRSCPTSSWS